jgi:hypothetical protein
MAISCETLILTTSQPEAATMLHRGELPTIGKLAIHLAPTRNRQHRHLSEPNRNADELLQQLAAA